MRNALESRVARWAIDEDDHEGPAGEEEEGKEGGEERERRETPFGVTVVTEVVEPN